jgi:tetratricopeptide (TPR) repeat protein
MKSITYVIRGLAFLCGGALLIAKTDPSSTAVEDAWRAWEGGNHQVVEQKLSDALKNDPDNASALFGLSALYSLEQRNRDAWTAFKSALDKEQTIYPYLYAAWVTPKLRSNINDPDLGIVPLLEGLTEHADSLGILKGMANEVLGNYYVSRGDLSRAHRYYQAEHSINDWMVIGPFDNTSASGHDKSFPPEKAFEMGATYTGKSGAPAQWFKITAMRSDNWVDFDRYFGAPSAVYYANTFIYSPKRQTVHLRIGTSGSFRLFLNDEAVLETSEEYNNDLDSYIVETELQEGWNRVLVKCGCSEIESCNFLLRITDPHGDEVADLKTSTDPQTYHQKPGAPARTVENFAETFFKAKIAADPDAMENYLLLADAYLRNDKGTEAELTLRSALEHWPSSPLLYDRILEAYQRGRKHDEIEKTLDKIYAIDQSVPGALEYKISEFLDKEQYDKAEEAIDQLDKILPGSQEVYGLRIGLYSKKGLTDKVIDLTHEGFKRFPDSREFTQAEAMVRMQVSKRYSEAIDLLQDYLRRNLDEEVLQQLASLYLSNSDTKNWRATYDRMLEIDPASPGYYHQIADGYFTMQDYRNAKTAVETALAICPSSGRLWERLGEIERIIGTKENAINDYKTALKYHPTAYDVRDELRELEGKQSLFKLFPETDVDSLIKHAPEASAYPEEKGVILLDEAQRVVYERGASESTQELVVKVFNDRGIDDWKEYTIGYNSYNEELTVDKAVVVKKDGSEVKADVDENYVVFKSLEENDIIHLKWRIRNYYSGKLSNQFWERYYFNSYYPSQHVRYEMIAPADFTFKYGGQNMTAEPVTTKLDEGTLYRWSADDVPAISYEYGMPGLDDVGKILYISSIPDWNYLVEWYADITKAKVRSSYEIKEQVASLLKEHPVRSDDDKIKMVYDFITENIRYSSVAFRQGAHIPQKARDVLVNKIGDCKDVATLCIAMLGELGLKANYVLVNTRDEGLNKGALPSISFNHCIVAVETSGGLKYLDLTANNFPYGSMPDHDLGAFALVIRPGSTAPQYLNPSGLLGRNIMEQTSASISPENVMTGHRKTSVTGSVAASFRASLRDQSKKDQEKLFLAGLTKSFPNAKLNGLTISNLDTPDSDITYEYSYEAPNYITEAGQFKFMKIPWSWTASADEALSYEKREYPYYYWPGVDTMSERVEITLPAGYTPVDLPKPIHLSSPVADYSMSYTFANGKLLAQRQFVNKKEVVEISEYSQFKSFFNSVVKEDTRQILFKKK